MKVRREGERDCNDVGVVQGSVNLHYNSRCINALDMCATKGKS